MKTVLFWVAIVVAIFSTYFVGYFLEKHHKQTWERLGSPQLMSDNFSPAYFTFLNFLYSGEFLKLKDWRLTVLVALALLSSTWSLIMLFLLLLT